MKTPFFRHQFRVLWTAASLVVVASSCAKSPPPPPEPIRVAAASDLQSVLPEIIKEYDRTPGKYPVVPVFGSSGKLAEQIKEGAPFDLFLAANESFVKDLAAKNVVKPESVATYAVGSLVLAINTDVSGKIQSINDLTLPEVKKLAIANPDFAPYGAAAKAALTKAGLWEAVQPKLVLAESVRQAFQFVESGNADAAFVGSSLVFGRKIRSIEIDKALYEPIVQYLAVVTQSPRASEADKFARFVLSPAGQVVFITFGFRPPPLSPTTP